MTRFAVRAEIMKLAQLLELEATELGYLETVAADDLRRLREQITDVIYDSGSHALGRLASASRLLPTSVVALIGEHAFGPMLAARIAGLLDPARAAEVAAKLPTPFLAEVATHLDPRRAAEVLRRMPPDRIAEVARELTAAEEHVTLGRFVGHLPDEAIGLALADMDDLTVLRVAFVLEDTEGADRVLALLDRARLERLLDAAKGTELWPDVLELFAGAPEPWRSQVLGARVA
ncbi:MAG TPA: hypothetical protein VKT31_10845 [Solirubrobacteraceae bacterium]|nr:hypothetical protein [Solirubrobacteraceae bacterium]